MEGKVGVEDMIQMDDLSLESILNNCKLRYSKDSIYSRIGNILVAVNPYKSLPDLFSLQQIEKVTLMPMTSGLPCAHVFALGRAVLHNLQQNARSQVVLISGESGAGKTETMKLLLQYFSQHVGINNKKHTMNDVEQRMLEANPILEAFGNAKTLRNYNSSRFGKFIEINFHPDGTMENGQITPYLLEKSRLVHQAPNERNFHIFYQLLSGLESLEDSDSKLLNLQGQTFKYMTNGLLTIPGQDDADEFDNVRNSFECFFDEDTQSTIFKLLAAILHTGNIQFSVSKDQAQIASGDTQLIAKLLSLDHTNFTHVLLKRSISVNNQVTTINLGVDQANDNRDALSKTLYESLFQFLVVTMNQKLSNLAKSHSDNYIGILDIFGFENFSENSLEQLLINFTNEKLKTFSNKHIFSLEQELYIAEKIDWQGIKFHEDAECLNFIEGRMGLFSILDEQCKFPNSNDGTFLDKLELGFAKCPVFSRPKLSKDKPFFTVQHYAGAVNYQVENFLEKNRNTLLQDVVNLFMSSKNPLVAALFSQLLLEPELGSTGTLRMTSQKAPPPSAAKVTPTPPQKPNRPIKTPLKQGATSTSQIGSSSTLSASPSASSRTLTSATMRNVRNSTVSGFKRELDVLIHNLSQADSFFVRCVKPNEKIAPNLFDDAVVCKKN